MDWLFDWFAKTWFWIWFSRRVLPYACFRLWGHPAYSMMNYYYIREYMAAHPDQVFAFVGVSRTNLSYLLNKLITGAKWSHAGLLYLDYTGEVRVHHVISSGYENWSLLSYLREVDAFQLHTLPVPPEKLERVRNRIKNIAAAGSGIEYDFSFELDDTVAAMSDEGPLPSNILFYCSELVYIVGYGIVPGFESHMELGRKTFEPDNVAEFCTRITIEAPLPPM